MFRKFLKTKEKTSGGSDLWNVGCFVRSIGEQVTAEVIRKYIRYQHDD